ncbi:MAG: HTTM domain-containing protein [Planctomycetota bacterium]|nr:HTTM domain-containing protein [Planctomycetota bacterium]
MSTQHASDTKRNAFSEFFFAEEVPYGMAFVRMLLPMVLLLVMVPRWIHARELFSLDGAAAPLADNYGYFDFVPVPGGTLAVALATLLVATLVTSSLGWFTRLSLCVSLIIYTYLNLLDCLSTLTKYSAIAAHGMLILSLSNCGAVWSVDSFLKRRAAARLRGDSPENGSPANWQRHRFPVWPRRLMQLLIGVIYLGAAFTKMHTPAFFSSDQMLHWLMTNVNNSNPVGEYLSFYPATLVVSAYVTVLWEVLFIFVAWRGWGRTIMLGLGVTFHLGTTLLLGLYIFPLVCFSLYSCYIYEEDVNRMAAFFSRLEQRGSRVMTRVRSAFESIGKAIPEVSPRQGLLVFGGVLLLLVCGGVGFEHQLDPMGARRAEGAWPLKELDPTVVDSMLRRSERVRESDKYLSFGIGSGMLGDVLINRRDTFQHGDPILAQCTLNPPHEDMWIECNLHDADNRIIDRVGQVADRSMLRVSYAFVLPESLEPGTYYLVVRSGGQEITRRPVQLLAR